jgi:hypothetical protein
MTDDPVSWLVVEPGWRVESAEGDVVGRVDEVAGDSSADIFDGLVVALSMFAKPRFVAAEQVAEITDGRVKLSLDRASAEALPEYVEPGESVAVSPEKAGIVTRLKSDVIPAPRTEHIPFLRRILLWFGLAGRR